MALGHYPEACGFVMCQKDPISNHTAAFRTSFNDMDKIQIQFHDFPQQEYRGPGPDPGPGPVAPVEAD